MTPVTFEGGGSGALVVAAVVVVGATVVVVVVVVVVGGTVVVVVVVVLVVAEAIDVVDGVLVVVVSFAELLHAVATAKTAMASATIRGVGLRAIPNHATPASIRPVEDLP